MSRYAYLVCPEANRYLFLGSIVQASGELPTGFWRNPSTFGDREFSEVLFRFLAESMNKQVMVLPEELMDQLLEDCDHLIQIGGDETGDISYAEYLAGSSKG